MLPKIAFVGAGSTVFTRNLVNDILRIPELAGHDGARAHGERRGPPRASETVTRRLIEANGAGATVHATLDRREALAGADHVVTSFQVGGLRPSTVIDFEVPKRYGLRQTIADTLGVGGIMRALRTIPVLLDVCARHGGALPGRAPAPVRQPDGSAALGGGGGLAGPHGRAVPLGAAHRGGAGEDLACRARSSTTTSRGSTTWRSSCRLERGGEDLYRAPRVIEEGCLPGGNRVRYEGVLRTSDSS